MLDLKPFLAPEREEFVRLLEGLGASEWQRPTECPAWTIKGIALHIVGDDLSLLSRQRDRATNSLTLYSEKHPGLAFRQLLDGFNDQWVEAATFISEALVLTMVRLTGQWSAEYYQSLALDEPSEPVGFFGASGPSPAWQVIAREYAERWIHQQQIRRALGREDLGEALASPAKEAVVLGFGSRFAQLGTFTAGGQTWPFRAGVDISLDESKADAVLSRGLTVEETRRSLHGETELVEAIANQTCRR